MSSSSVKRTCCYSARREWERHIGAALGIKAIKNGFTVIFVTLDKLIERLKLDEETPWGLQGAGTGAPTW